MKSHLITLALLLAGSVSQAAPSLYAEFRGFNHKTRYAYEIKQSKNEKWTVQITPPCPSYPCSPRDLAVTESFTPVLISDETIADGGTEVALGETYRIIFINNGMVAPNPDGTREESYWKLEIIEDGQIRDVIKLSFFARLKG